jgi:glycosyltransferase involved in cell wall biosynthesis
MRVAFVTHYSKLYGANRSLLALIDGLRRHQVSSCVVLPGEGPMAEALRARGVPLLVAPTAIWVAKPIREQGLLKQLLRYTRRRLGALMRACANLVSLPIVAGQMRRWGTDVVYSNSSVLPIGVLASRLLGLPHVWHLREFGDLDFGLRPDWGQGLVARALASADAVIAISQAVRSHLLSGRTYEVAHVICNGVAWESDFDRLRDAARSAPRAGEAYCFALVGVIDEAKGQETAIRALAITADRFPAVRLLIAGGGDTGPLRRLAADLGVEDKVEFLGYVEDPFEVYLGADAVLMCSRSEAMGRVTAEAMAASRPVIGHDAGATSELVEHGVTGLLYRGGPESLASCMMRFVDLPDWARQLGENGWLAARGKYTIEAYSDAVYRVLCSVTDVPARA